MRELGTYVILASERADFSLDNNRAQATQLVLTKMVVLGRPTMSTLVTEIDVRGGRDGQAVAGTRVDFGDQRAHPRPASSVRRPAGRLQAQLFSG